MLRNCGSIPDMRSLAILSCLALASCAQLAEAPTQNSRPRTVAEAVQVVRDWLDEQERRELAYMREADLILLHHGFGTGIRNGLGLWGGNTRLLEDCGSMHPDDCSSIIIEKLHARLRAELSAAERSRLETLERGLEEVELPALQVPIATLAELASWLQAQVDSQLPVGGRIQVRYGEEDAKEAIDIEPREAGTLAEFIGSAGFLGLDVIKQPPDLLIAPYWRPLGDLPVDAPLPKIFAAPDGLREETRELIKDDAAWNQMWGRISAMMDSRAPAPAVDFTAFHALVIALGERSGGDHDIELRAMGRHRDAARVTVVETQPADDCRPTGAKTHPTAVFLIPREADSVDYWESTKFRKCAER
jgi:hypothetical protein